MERYTKAMGIAALTGALLFAAIAVPLTVQSAGAAGANMTKNATAVNVLSILILDLIGSDPINAQTGPNMIAIE